MIFSKISLVTSHGAFSTRLHFTAGNTPCRKINQSTTSIHSEPGVLVFRTAQVENTRLKCSGDVSLLGNELGDNDRAARVLFVQHPREQGECFWRNHSPCSRGCWTNNTRADGHYSHYNTKLTNSRYFHGNSHRIALTEPQSRPSCSWKSSEHCHPLCT